MHPFFLVSECNTCTHVYVHVHVNIDMHVHYIYNIMYCDVGTTGGEAAC